MPILYSADKDSVGDGSKEILYYIKQDMVTEIILLMSDIHTPILRGSAIELALESADVLYLIYLMILS